MAEPALATPPLNAIDSEAQEVLALCGGDPMTALRIALIASAFLEARIDELTQEASSGFSRGRVRKARKA
jgi:hypothetical protein